MFTEHLVSQFVEDCAHLISPEQASPFAKTVRQSFQEMEASYARQIQSARAAVEEAPLSVGDFLPFLSSEKRAATQQAKSLGHAANMEARNRVVNNFRNYFDEATAEKAADHLSGLTYDSILENTQTAHITLTEQTPAASNLFAVNAGRLKPLPQKGQSPE